MRIFHYLETLRLNACIERDFPGLARQLRNLQPPVAENWRVLEAELAGPACSVADSIRLSGEYVTQPPPETFVYQGRLDPARVAEKLQARLRREKQQFRLALTRQLRELTDDERDRVVEASGGKSPRELSHGLLDALDPDKAHDRAQEQAGGAEPAPEQVEAARAELLEAAIAPFDNPDLCELLTSIKARTEQVIDRVTRDRLIGVGYSVEDTERARQMVASFYAFLQENHDEIAALQIIFGQPYGQQRLTYGQVKELAARIEMPPNVWTTEALWRAYAQLERDKVRGVGAKRVLTDLVSLVRHAVQMEDELIPYPDLVWRRYRDWLEMQESGGWTASPRRLA